MSNRTQYKLENDNHYFYFRFTMSNSEKKIFLYDTTFKI